MLTNYFRIAWRNIVRDKLYAFLSISGLAIGLAVFITVLVFVNHERSYDRWDASLSQVYRVGISKTDNGEKSELFWTPYSLGTEINQELSNIEGVTRIVEQGEQLVETGGNRFYEKKIILADSGFFAVFPYTFTSGYAGSALNKPQQAAISADISKKYFGKENPVGKTISISTGYQEPRTYTITGVFRKTGPSHLNFDICLSYFNSDPGRWGRRIFQTYVKTKAGAAVKAIEQKAGQLFLEREAAYQFSNRSGNNKNIPAPGKDIAGWLNQYAGLSNTDVFLEPVGSIHLDPRASGWRDDAANHPVYDAKKGNDKPLYYFSLAAGLILILAAINYTNFCVARAGRRAKETGVRKVMGATRRQLIIQFMAEATVQTLAALLLAIGLCTWLLQVINTQFAMDLQLWDLQNNKASQALLWQIPLIVLTVTLIAGIYPAFILSSFQPASVLKGNITRTIKGKLLRHALLVVQFTISAAFMTILAVVTLQLRFMQQHDRGFDGDQVLVLTPANKEMLSIGEPGYRWPELKKQLLQVPGVEKATATVFYPGQPSVAEQEANFMGRELSWFFDYVHFDYFETLGMKLVAGRSFSDQYGLDTVNAAVINETAARQLGAVNPIGQRVNYLLRDYTVIGVVKDNFSAGYTRTVSPGIFIAGAEEGMLRGYDHILVKIKAAGAAQTVDQLNALWKKTEPAFPLRYKWLDEEFGRMLIQYKRFGIITMCLAIISTLIALLGIYALSAFAAAQRTREVGIRKVFGASVMRITTMLSKDFAWMLLIALLIGMPVAYMASSRWLTDFAYRIPLHWSIFFLTGVAVTIIALFTVSIQAIRTARKNPVTNIRTE